MEHKISLWASADALAYSSDLPSDGDDNNVAPAAHTTHPRLCKVPAHQRKANPDAFTPFLFSFGPYHGENYSDKACTALPLANSALADGAYLKQRTAGCACPLANSALADGAYLKQRTADGLLSPQQRERLVFLIADRNAQILSQYVERLVVDMSDDGRLALLLAVDAITIVAAVFSQELQTPSHVRFLVISDAILLENQIPVFLLELALQAIFREGICQRLEHTIKRYCFYGNPFTNWELKVLPALEETAKREPLLSFLYDHVHALLVPTQEDREVTCMCEPSLEKEDKCGMGPSPLPASRLARCGVQFQVTKAYSYVFFDSQKCILFLPKIMVSHNGLRVMHNLLAYEATARYPKQHAFVSYVHLMDCLIDTADDVHILTDAGIINNKLGSHEELASMWNKLCSYVMFHNTKSDRTIMVKLDALSKQRWKKWKAGFREVYWEKQPWLLFSILAAVILLILSFLQTIFTILAYNV